jgi:hypothetical protein
MTFSGGIQIMAANVLGISASPFAGGNVERMITHLIERSGSRGEMVRLAELEFKPCLGCAYLCAGDNLCKLDDGLLAIFPKILDADVLVLGGPSYFNGPNGYMLLLLERLWCMRHQRFPLEGTPFFVVASGGVKEPSGVIEAVKARMEAYRARFTGSVSYFSGNLPCFKCGYGGKCQVGSIKSRFTPEEIKGLKWGRSLFQNWEVSPQAKDQMEQAVVQLKQLV